jgi:hypothetical protein
VPGPVIAFVAQIESARESFIARSAGSERPLLPFIGHALGVVWRHLVFMRLMVPLACLSLLGLGSAAGLATTRRNLTFRAAVRPDHRSAESGRDRRVDKIVRRRRDIGMRVRDFSSAHPRRIRTSTLRRVVDETWGLWSIPSYVCSGDSGGGIFLNPSPTVANEDVLAANVSDGGRDCRRHNNNNRLDTRSIQNWINDMLGAAPVGT